ncbi:MAG: hypothetical protein ACRC80_02880 [Waterburya sp.]
MGYFRNVFYPPICIGFRITNRTRALRDAALEAFGGAYQEEELLKMIDIAEIKQSAINLLNSIAK